MSLLLCAAGNALWKKHKSSGSVPHLARRFDHVAQMPECVSAVEELAAMDSKKIRAAAQASATAGANGNDTDKKNAGQYSVYSTLSAGRSRSSAHEHIT